MNEQQFQKDVISELEQKQILSGLAVLRKAFPEHQISKLPKPTKQQTEEVKADYTKGIRCAICGTWHHPKVVHLDYVGHAALTDRLLDADSAWNWEPLVTDSDGMPALDKNGGMWIRLTVCGVTRLGYGDAEGKVGGNAVKERIGDALRNAAMRFGAALDLWHKGDLHAEELQEEKPKPKAEVKPERKTMTIADLKKYSTDKVDGDGVVTKCSAKSLIERQEETAQNLIDFLSAKYLLPEDVIREIQSWERGDAQ